MKEFFNVQGMHSLSGMKHDESAIGEFGQSKKKCLASLTAVLQLQIELGQR